MASKKSYKLPKHSSGVLFVDSISAETKKVCRICKIEKNISLFPYHSSPGGARSTKCKKCKVSLGKETRHIKKTAHPKPTDGKCECCNKPTNKWCVDHNHTTKKFRGWICHDCNTSIGKLGDTLEGVMKAVYYLRKAEKRNSPKEKKNEKSDGLY